ncbi:MAG: GreA/GreB family elongation factor [Actinomycetota bacterium]
MARIGGDEEVMMPTSSPDSTLEGDPAGLFLTPAGRESLAARLAELETLARTLLRQLADGNADDITAVTYGRATEEIVRLTAALEAARSVEELPPDPRCVVLGDTVTVGYPDGEASRYVIVHPLEAPVEERRISSDSPLGRALLGRHVGEVVEVDAPGGRYRCRIESAERR